MHTEFFELLKSSAVDFGKISASCSGIHQPSDVSPIFKSVKARLKTIIKKDTDVSNDILEAHMRNLFKETPHKVLKEVSPELKNKIIYGCLSIKYALEDCMRPRLIRDGFKNCGQFPLSYKAIMDQCYSEITHEDFEAMKEATDMNVEYFLKHGQLTEEQLTATGIPEFEVKKGDNTVPRDKRVLNHQRAVLLSHPETIDRYTEYVNKGLPIGETIVQVKDRSERKELMEAAKIVGKEKKKKESAEKRKLEATRKAQLSKEEKAAESAQKRAKVEAKKAQDTIELEEAKRKLGIKG